MLEHRWSARVAANHEVLVSYEGRYGTPGKIRNISLYGMYVEVCSTFPENSYVQVQFRLPAETSPPPSLGGMVVHRTSVGMGLIIDAAQARTADRLQALFDHCTQQALSLRPVSISKR